ncbi:MAG: RloB domain-containing protein [Cyanobacteria bacterium SBLK]|nr:RloB domain-containing protein [Cyanobacteria bacterium SBLK]
MFRERTNLTRMVDEISKKYSGKLFIIVAEGDKTERNYFKTFRIKYEEDFRKKDLYFEFLDRENPSQSSPQAVYQRIQNFCERLKSKKREITEDDEFWIVIDTDDYGNRKEIIEKIAEDCEKPNNYYLALNNPCFEIWLICHLIDLDTKLGDCLDDFDEDQTIQEYIESIGMKGRPKICKTIFTQLHQNKGIGNLYEVLIDRIPEAIPRAKKLGQCCPRSDLYPQKIGTNLYQLFENLGYPATTS